MTDAQVTATAATENAETPAHGIPFREAVRVGAKVAALSFGGPAGQIAVMHRILVERKKWIGEIAWRMPPRSLSRSRIG